MKTLRQATTDDIPAIAEIRRRSFFTVMPHMPVLHSAKEEVAFISQVVFPSTNIWLVEGAASVIGFIIYRKD